jgi:phage shock protein C
LEKRLYRSRENTVIGGVCGGIAEYLDIDPTIVRLIWVFSALYGGIGIIAYLVCLIVIPENRSGAPADMHVRPQMPVPPEEQYDTSEHPDAKEQQGAVPPQDEGIEQDAGMHSGRNRLLAGSLLIGIGGLLLFKRWFYWVDLGRYWPVLLIIAGILVIINGTKNRGGKQ